MPTLTEHARNELAALTEAGRMRQLRGSTVEGGYVIRNGKKLLNFAGNDYLGLSQHPSVRAAADTMAGATSSRLVLGEHSHYALLEKDLAAYHGQEAALVFSSGYTANLGVISALLEPADLILSDKLAHASMLDGARLSGAVLKRFRHNDLAHAEALLKEHRRTHRRCLLMTEAIFSMDGDAAPLSELAALAMRYDAWLLVDAAHALEPLPIVPDLLLGTLSKSFASLGGYVAASRPVIDLLIATARPLIFSTALPPGVVAAAHAALQVAKAEPERGARAWALARRLAAHLNLPMPAAAILPIPVGGNAEALRLAQALEERGFSVAAIRPPTVPPGTARLRVSINALHSESQIDALAEAIHAEQAALKDAR